MLTKRQAALLRFIRSYTKEHGFSPSYDDMANGLGLNSKSPIHAMVIRLEQRGHIRRLAHRARAIEVIQR